MIRTDTVPEATALPEYHADYLELCTLRNSKRIVSVQEFIRDLRIGNATEVIADSSNRDEDVLDDESEALAQTAFDELDERCRNSGTDAAYYPFTISENTIKLKAGGEDSLYIFLALLSWYGKDAGPKGTDGEKLFEDVCAKAAEAYLGGPSLRVKSVVFGFPRHVLPKNFADALDALCNSMGEGGGHRKRSKLPDQKDEKLDIVAWVEFQDSREGKLITFGQCATGKNWNEKISELPSPSQWCDHWMLDAPSVSATRSFFVPHRVTRDSWLLSCRYGGILYDRCRITSLVSNERDLKKQWAAWSAHVLTEIRRTGL